ncbi:hypothetical protein [Salinispora arenicola]|uniref:hypothetical protein n=1 Tax=Salinispora arenicola TaxID=168697 RepID=UPI0012BC3E32|nr:hypothetical protein [Salinispora arenicola]NIL61410.1 hypothetical protein [Salinispora arenicola]
MDHDDDFADSRPLEWLIYMKGNDSADGRKRDGLSTFSAGRPEESFSLRTMTDSTAL